MRSLGVIALAAVFAVGSGSRAAAEDADVKSVLERYAALRPGPAALGMYRLDWADSLADALKRAKAGKRPILLVVIHAQYGDMFSGHC